MIAIDSTVAKIGRSMKKRENIKVTRYVNSGFSPEMPRNHLRPGKPDRPLTLSGRVRERRSGRCSGSPFGERIAGRNSA